MPPQIWQLPIRPAPPLMHTRPSRQPLGLQQGSPVPPQREHIVIPRRQEDCDAVQVERSQQGSATLPQETPAEVWHDPSVHVPAKPTMGGEPG